MNEAPPIIPPLPVPSHKDRRTGLILFGSFEILLGALCLLMVGFMFLGQTMLARTSGAPMHIQTLIPALISYVALAAIFVWLGVGSIQCRRWARALLLILAWLWLCTGLVTVPMMAWLMPRILASPPPGGQALPPGVMAMVVVFQIVFLSVFFVVIPGGLLLFYRSRHVKDTCEARDPVPRWTDACPLPLLAVTCLAWSGAAFMLAMPLTGLAMLPFFGALVTGLPGALLMLAMAAAFFWIGRSWYRQRVAGWWALLCGIIVFAISSAITFSRVDILEVYQKLGYPQAQIDLIQKQGWLTSEFMMWSSLIWVLPMLGYLLWAKRFFRTASLGR